MDPGIVANVDDRSQFMTGAWVGPGAELPPAEQLLHAEQEAGAANPTNQNGDLHIGRQYRRRYAAPFLTTTSRSFEPACDRHAEIALQRKRRNMVTR